VPVAERQFVVPAFPPVPESNLEHIGNSFPNCTLLSFASFPPTESAECLFLYHMLHPQSLLSPLDPPPDWHKGKDVNLPIELNTIRRIVWRNHSRDIDPTHLCSQTLVD
jgi:hypothetical protein